MKIVYELGTTKSLTLYTFFLHSLGQASSVKGAFVGVTCSTYIFFKHGLLKATTYLTTKDEFVFAIFVTEENALA